MEVVEKSRVETMYKSLLKFLDFCELPPKRMNSLAVALVESGNGPRRAEPVLSIFQRKKEDFI
jgi:hypothetical protein